MGTMVALGLGIIIGGVAAFPAGQRYMLFKQQRDLAAEHWGVARGHLSRAVGPVALFLVVVAVGLAFIVFGG